MRITCMARRALADPFGDPTAPAGLTAQNFVAARGERRVLLTS